MENGPRPALSREDAEMPENQMGVSPNDVIGYCPELEFDLFSQYAEPSESESDDQSDFMPLTQKHGPRVPLDTESESDDQSHFMPEFTHPLLPPRHQSFYMPFIINKIIHSLVVQHKKSIEIE